MKTVIKPIKMSLELRENTKGRDFPELARLLARNWKRKEEILEALSFLK
jgi:hypothetical protein